MGGKRGKEREELNCSKAERVVVMDPKCSEVVVGRVMVGEKERVVGYGVDTYLRQKCTEKRRGVRTHDRSYNADFAFLH